MYVCMYVRMYVCMYVGVCIYNIYIYIHTIYIYICITPTLYYICNITTYCNDIYDFDSTGIPLGLQKQSFPIRLDFHDSGIKLCTPCVHLRLQQVCQDTYVNMCTYECTVYMYTCIDSPRTILATYYYYYHYYCCYYYHY